MADAYGTGTSGDTVIQRMPKDIQRASEFKEFGRVKLGLNLSRKTRKLTEDTMERVGYHATYCNLDTMPTGFIFCKSNEANQCQVVKHAG